MFIRNGLSRALKRLTNALGVLLGEQFVQDRLRDYAIEALPDYDTYDDASPGAWFGQTGIAAEVKTLLHQRIVCDMIFHTISASGKPVWDTVKLTDFIRAADDVSDLLFFLLQTTTAQPARVPRMAYLLYKNVPTARRGVYVRRGRVYVQGHWDKNRGHGPLAGIRFPDRDTSALLQLDLCFLRPLYDIATMAYNEAVGQQQLQLYATHRSLLLHRRGRQVSEDHLRKRMRYFCSVFFLTTDVGVSEWRHGSKALVRQHIPHIEAVAGFEEDADRVAGAGPDTESLWAAMADHTPQTAVEHYAVTALPHEGIAKTQGACSAWHVLLELTPSSLPSSKHRRPGADTPMAVTPPQAVVQAVLEQLSVSPEFRGMQTAIVVDALRTVLAESSSHGRAPWSTGGFDPRPQVATCFNPSLEDTARYLLALRNEVGESANFRGPNQLALLHALLTADEDCLGVVRVGGGKSTLLNLAARVSKTHHNVAPESQ